MKQYRYLVFFLTLASFICFSLFCGSCNDKEQIKKRMDKPFIGGVKKQSRESILEDVKVQSTVFAEFDSILNNDSVLIKVFNELSKETIIAYVNAGVYRYFEDEHLSTLFVRLTKNQAAIYQYYCENDSICKLDSSIYVENPKLIEEESLRLCKSIKMFDGRNCSFGNYVSHSADKKHGLTRVNLIFKGYDFSIVLPYDTEKFNIESFVESRQLLYTSISATEKEWFVYCSRKNENF